MKVKMNRYTTLNRVDMFYVMFDTKIHFLEERFELLKVQTDYFSFLYNISLLSTFNKNELLKHYMDLHTYLSDADSLNSDINGLGLKDELLLSFITLIGSNEHQTNNPLNILKYIKNDLENTFPNLAIPLRI
ncbi:unnamed protein product [Psylliodes chrysocephalus]|uniref:Uncharacterized protein n=1 Tax=Psylliodes chrysocephalus TaxID=3402493 RepID=A0A9P0D9G4_9CUCU|nr:unnamed protein product [Psylliodes chrysocephala]